MSVSDGIHDTLPPPTNLANQNSRPSSTNYANRNSRSSSESQNSRPSSTNHANHNSRSSSGNFATDSSSSQNEKPNCWKRFTNSKCFKYTKIIIIIIYALNIVAWGGMLFLILVGAANQTMSDKEIRDIWIEIDSQILNALFSITGIGLIPWRLRDLIQLYSRRWQPKLLKNHSYTKDIFWISIVVWTFIANSLFQIGMAVTMWSMDRFTRPPWLVGVFVGLGCVSGAVAGLIQFILGRKTKKQKKMEQEAANILDS